METQTVKKARPNGGFIMTIVIIIVAIVLLKFWFGFNIIDFLKTPKVSEWTSYIREFIAFVWTHYLKEAFTVLFNFIVDLIKGLKK